MTLPSDLDRLGRQLELAADGALRRRARRRRMLAALAAAAVTVPVTLALAAGGPPPAAEPPPVSDPGFAAYEPASADNVAVRQAQGARSPSVPTAPACLDSNHCGRAAPPMRLVSYPDPARRA